MKWIKYESDDCYAIVTCKYVPVDSNHMEMQIGDFVVIKEQYPGWYRGFKYSQPCLLRVFPNTHVKILSGEIHPDLWAEIFSWITNIRDIYLLADHKQFEDVCEAVQLTMAEKRYDCLQEKSKVTETNRRLLVPRMEFARRMLGLPIESLNDKLEKISLTNTSVLDMYNQHNKVQETHRNISSGLFDNTVENVSIFVKMLNIDFDRSIHIDEYLDVVISLYKYEEKTRVGRMSESYTYRVGMSSNQSNLIKNSAVVTKDIQFVPNSKVFVVFQFIRIGQMLTNKKQKKETETKFRRPLGVAVYDITTITLESTQEPAIQVAIQIMQKEESIETVTERMIQDYKSNKGDFRSVITVQFKAIKNDELSDRYIVISGMNPYYPSPIRSTRNCLYLNLNKADIDRGVKKSDPNFEIDISIRDEMGNPVCMPKDEWRGISSYKSVIYYHIGKPRWNEFICIPLFEKLKSFPAQTHVRFVIWHRSLNSRSNIPHGVAFMKLFPKSNSCMIIGNKEHDKSHILTIYKMDLESIRTAKYLQFSDEIDSSMESLTSSNLSSTLTTGWNTMVRKKKCVNSKDTLSVQTLLISNEYTFDELLANICCNNSVDEIIIQNLCIYEIVVKNIDVNELKKFAIKILESGLELLQRADSTTLLGRNILILLGEMFKAIKNLPEYQGQMNKFITDTMQFNVHKQILHELINHAPEIDSNTLRASDWFMKIVVKSYQNLNAGSSSYLDDTRIFNDMVDRFLQKLELWANRNQNQILRRIVLSKAGSIIKALIPVCRPIGMANLVNNLLETSRDLDAIPKAGLTMDCMNSRLFMDPECRRIILPETTRNMLELLNTQLDKIYQGREIDQDHMLDNICEKMVEFMLLHERSWQNATAELRDTLVNELLIENDMLRSCIRTMSSGLEFLRRDDATCKLLYKPLMVLVTVIITSLSFLSPKLWEKILASQVDACNYCGLKEMSNNYDMIIELLSLISQLQLITVFPDCCNPEVSNHRLSNYNKLLNISSEVIQRQHRVTKQPWFDLLFVQSRQFLLTIGQIHKTIIQPYYLSNLIQIQRLKQGRLCCCHPSDKLQGSLLERCVECIELIITQPFLKLEQLPPSSALRMMQNSTEWDSDIRQCGAHLIKDIWHNLDTLKIIFSSFFFCIFSKLTTIHNYKIRLLAVECMFDIVHLDHENKRKELITHIDQAMERADISYCEEMSKALKQVLSNNSHRFVEDHQLVENIMVQMNNIQECSQHLNDNSPINGMIVINNLRQFYQKMGRSDIIGRYLFKLIAIHTKIGNFTETGYTLLELSSFYKWSHSGVRDTFFPIEYIDCELEWQLKAQLLEESLKCFETEDWEQGLEVCKELINGYSTFMVDFVKLSEVHKKMSELFKRIMYEDRPESSTYIIFYFGTGFPKFITELPHKSIVLTTKRNANEVLMDLNSQFKNTTVEKRFPSEDDEVCVDRKIFFMPIKANQFEIPTKYEGKCVKQRVLKYYENYNIDEYVFKRLKNNTEEDPTKRKIEGCIIKCDGKLPNILSVVPVKSLLRESIDPFNEALFDLQNQIRKDNMLYQDYEIASQEKRETMYQKMKDVILKYISPVSGGVSKLVDMIPDNDKNNLSFAGDIVSQVFALIFLYLQTFEIYDNSDSYNIFLTEFRKILKAVSVRLDICEEDFSINTLPEQFNRSRGNVNMGMTMRKMSIVVRPHYDDEGQRTISKGTKLPKEFFEEMATSDRRESGISEEDYFQAASIQPRIDINEPLLPPKRQSTSDMITAFSPPLPPKPKFIPRGVRDNSNDLSRNENPPVPSSTGPLSPLSQNLEPPPKPNLRINNGDVHPGLQSLL